MIRSIRLLAALVAMALIGSGCSLVGGGSTYEIVAYFPRAVSLYEAGAVQVLGLPAGEVTGVEVQGDLVKVTMAIDSDVPLPDDVRAALVPQSLIGERRVQLFPPYQEGATLAQDGHEIAVEDTIIPIEPDEALEALKEFLDSLDPAGVGRLIDNAATALDGQGDPLGGALDELSTLVGNIERNDDDIIRIAERFDDFTATLLTREAQLGEVLDHFAVVADVLADERDDIETLLAGLASISNNGFDLVSEHAVRLRTDIEIVTRLVRAVDTNLAAVTQATEGTSRLVDGFIGAYNEDLRAFDLRNNFGPLLSEALSPIFDAAGIPFPCLPVDVSCGDDGLAPLAAGGPAVPADLVRPTSPVDDVIALLGSPTARDGARSADEAAPAPKDRGLLSTLLGTFLGVGS